MKKEIKKILIANRSEIAARIIDTCKSLGIKTVAIYTKEDKFSSFVYQADESYELAQNGLLGYLNQDEIISIAKNHNCNAIHPGYGLLSEIGEFATKTSLAGLTFIGPSGEQIALMGDKIKSKELMQQINIPTIPGITISENYDIQEIKKEINKIGYPIILKATLGGGGKAMRKVTNEDELEKNIQIVQRESAYLFNSLDLFAEKFIENGKHIEIQIAGDGKNIIHLFERDCSVQRRHQKFIEEAPSKFIRQKCLEKLYESAIKAAQSISYTNLGTVEFIVTPDEKFYFLEMNTRLQVEHPITESITGLDLVELQIKIAENDELPLTQNEISKQGYAIECRILAEDTKNNFAPSTGCIEFLSLPKGPFIRQDHILEEKMEITSYFDSMLAKITTNGQNRKAAISKMIKALNEFKIEGIATNIDFLKFILQSKEFENGLIFTDSFNKENFSLYSNFLKNPPIKKDDNSENEQDSTEEEISLIGAILSSNSNKEIRSNINPPKQSNWKRQGWK